MFPDHFYFKVLGHNYVYVGCYPDSIEWGRKGLEQLLEVLKHLEMTLDLSK